MPNPAVTQQELTLKKVCVFMGNEKCLWTVDTLRKRINKCSFFGALVGWFRVRPKHQK